MQFLKTMSWIAVAVLVILFSIANWEPVSVLLWGGLQLDTKLPVLVISAFLLGFLPLWLYHRTTRWRLKRRIATLEANQTVTAPPQPSPAAGSTVPPRSALPREQETTLSSV